MTNILEKLRQKSPLVQASENLRTQIVLEEHKREAGAQALRSFFVKPQSPALLLPSPSILDRIADINKKKNPHGYAEINRIINLPICWPLTEKELEAYNQVNVLADQYADGFRLWERQAMCLLSYELYGGVFGPVSVGEGKTLITVAIASKAFEKGVQKILLLVPPNVYGQLVRSNLSWIRNHIPVRVPIILMGGLTPKKRAEYANSRRPGCYILPYSCLSTEDAEDILHAIKARTIICDEAHSVSARRSARTRRLMNYITKMEEARPSQPIEFIALSGTITGKSVMDYHHLMRHALKYNSPLPLSPQMASNWGQYIDAKAEEFTAVSVGPIQSIVDWARGNFSSKEITTDVTGFREAYQIRLRSAPGVVASSENSLGVSLVISNSEAALDRLAPEWIKLEALVDQVVEDFVTPQGDQIEHAIHTFKWLFELSAGFYNELRWPTVEQLMSRRSVTKDEAADVLERSQQHNDLEQIFHKELRKWIYSRGSKGLDTPLLVNSTLARTEGNHPDFTDELVYAWKDMKAAEFDDMPVRVGKAIRIHDFKVQAALHWEKHRDERKKKGSIIWVHNQEVGIWATELFTEAGLDPLYCDAGEVSNAALDFDRHPENATRTVIASIAAHGQGKNLQHFQHQYMLQWPRPARIAEQLLGRLHRNGQKADEIIAHTNHTTLFDHLNFAACLNDALYIQQTTGNRQRIIYAGYDPLPSIFPPQVLRERGLQVKMLTTKQQQVMQELFGTTPDKKNT